MTIRPGSHDSSGIHKTTVFGALSVGTITYRNLYMIGRMGAELQRRQAQSGKTPGSVSLVVGQLHGDIQDVLNGYGAKVTAAGPKPGKLVNLLKDCARRCELTPRDVEDLNAAILEDLLGF